MPQDTQVTVATTPEPLQPPSVKKEEKPVKKAVVQPKPAAKPQPKPTPNVSGTTVDLAAKIIAAHEGVHLTAYHDRTRWSIGYGTVSYQGEVITKEEALRRFEEALGTRVAQVKKDYPNLKAHEQAALVSLMYNCPNCYYRIGKKAIVPNTFIRWSLQGTKYEKGINKRAKNEYALFAYGVIY